MEKLMRKLFVLLVVATASLVPPQPAVADTARIPSSGWSQLTAVIDPGRVWVSDDVQHGRGFVARYSSFDAVYGAGTTTVVANWNLNLSTGDGTSWGTATTELEAIDGGFVGTFTATFSNFVWSGHGVSHGYGELTGCQARVGLRATGPGRDEYSGFGFCAGS